MPQLSWSGLRGFATFSFNLMGCVQPSDRAKCRIRSELGHFSRSGKIQFGQLSIVGVYAGDNIL